MFQIHWHLPQTETLKKRPHCSVSTMASGRAIVSSQCHVMLYPSLSPSTTVLRLSFFRCLTHVGQLFSLARKHSFFFGNFLVRCVSYIWLLQLHCIDLWPEQGRQDTIWLWFAENQNCVSYKDEMFLVMSALTLICGISEQLTANKLLSMTAIAVSILCIVCSMQYLFSGTITGWWIMIPRSRLLPSDFNFWESGISAGYSSEVDVMPTQLGL